MQLVGPMYRKAMGEVSSPHFWHVAPVACVDGERERGGWEYYVRVIDLATGCHDSGDVDEARAMPEQAVRPVFFSRRGPFAGLEINCSRHTTRIA